jgi:hypothetical protein
MADLEPYSAFEDELAATRRQLRRLEKLALALKRRIRIQPRNLSPLFQLREVQKRLAMCEALLKPNESARTSDSPTGKPQLAEVVLLRPARHQRHTKPAYAISKPWVKNRG